MRTVSEIYNFIGDCLTSQITESWIKSELKIEITEGMVGYNGGFVNSQEEYKSFSVRDFPRELRKEIKNLHKTTTEGGNNRWNRAIFRLYPDGKFDMEFIWDQELHDEIDRLNKE